MDWGPDADRCARVAAIGAAPASAAEPAAKPAAAPIVGGGSGGGSGGGGPAQSQGAQLPSCAAGWRRGSVPG